MDHNVLLVMRNTILSTLSSRFPFCCDSSSTLNPQNALCSMSFTNNTNNNINYLLLDFPVCSEMCKEADGCNCPFESVRDPNDGTPIFGGLNDTCSCAANYGGYGCTQNCMSLLSSILSPLSTILCISSSLPLFPCSLFHLI